MAETFSNISSKEMIAARMFRHAMRYWESNDTDIDNFDPLVRLLIEACAVELYRISNEISSVQENMLEKLAMLLTPEVYIAPKPAHAIVHARAVEPYASIFREMQFLFQKKISSKPNGSPDTNLEIFFSPAGSYKIIDGDAKLIAYGAGLFNINRTQYKEQFLKSSGGKKITPGCLWLGIELNYQVTSLSGLSFFFDLKNHPDKSQLLPLVHYSKFTVNGIVLDTAEGLWSRDCNKPVLETYEGFDEFDMNQTIEKNVNLYYCGQFITILNGEETTLNKEKYPSEFTGIFSSNDLAKLQKDLLWIKIEFLPEFDETVFEDIMVCMNCFPVINRRLNELSYRLQNNFNIIPLVSAEQFLSVHTAEDTDADNGKDANIYSGLPFGNTSVPDMKGTYTLRTGDVERFDSRNAMEYMNYLLELLRDESSAFAALGQDFVASQIKELNQNIAQLEQKIKQNISILNQQTAYMLIKPRKEGETIFVNYWTTNGEAGNSIRSGSKLDLYQGNDIQIESLVAVTNGNGGRDKLKNTEVLNVYKNTLLTRSRIVTLKDIKDFCIIITGNRAKSIEVQKGVVLSALPHEGLIDTIKIIITPQNAFSKAEDEWESVIRDLQIQLQQQSPVMSHYTILLATN